MNVYLSDWSFEDKDKLCSQPWEIDGDDDWYREDLYCGFLLLDDWTCDTLIAAVEKDVADKLSVEEILLKYVKSTK